MHTIIIIITIAFQYNRIKWTEDIYELKTSEVLTAYDTTYHEL